MKIETGVFLAIIYPDDKSKGNIAQVFAAAKKALKDATKSEPHIIHPDVTCVCLLVEGDQAAISRALDLSLGSDIRWLVVRCETPIASFGLNVSQTFLDSRLGRNQK